MTDRALYAHAFLFAEGGALSWKRLSALVGCTEAEVHNAVRELAATLEGSGLTIVETPEEVALATASSASEAVQQAYEAQLQRDIGEAGLEVLAIVLYRGPSSRSQIDYIRGVNTSSTIRTLLSRGLLQRRNNAEDSREYIYQPTPELLSHLGVSKQDDLPDYGTIRSELAAFEDSKTPFDGYATGQNEDRADAAGI